MVNPGAFHINAYIRAYVGALMACTHKAHNNYIGKHIDKDTDTDTDTHTHTQTRTHTCARTHTQF